MYMLVTGMYAYYSPSLHRYYENNSPEFLLSGNTSPIPPLSLPLSPLCWKEMTLQHYGFPDYSSLIQH